MVGKFERGCSSAAFPTIDGDKVRANPSLHYGFANGQKFTPFAHTQLKSDGLATTQLSQLGNEFEQSNWS